MWVVTGSLMLISILLMILFLISSLKQNKEGDQPDLPGNQQPLGQRFQRHLSQFYQQAYSRSLGIPGLKGYVLKVRKRLEVSHTYDGYSLRKETMRIVFMTLGMSALFFMLLVLLNSSLMFIVWVLIAMLVLNGMLIDVFVHRVEDRLMKQLVQTFSQVRHYYQQHKMVDEAIYEAAQASDYEASVHIERIHHILTSQNPKDMLDRYYETAPNRYVKIFAGISYFIMEFGDKMVSNGSLYLNAINRLTQEMNFDILRREKLGQLLKGLTVIALLPALFTAPLEAWAKAHFPAIEDFYAGKIGLLFKISVFLIIILAYVLLRKMLENDETYYRARPKRKWLKTLYQVPAIRWAVTRFAPGGHTKQHFQVSTLLKETNSQLTVEWFYMQRLLLVLITLVGVVGLFIYMHAMSAERILHAPTKPIGFFGKLPTDEQAKAQEITDFDRSVIEDLRRVPNVTKERVIHKVSELTNHDRNASSVILTSERIFGKLILLKSEYFKWWELLIGIALSIIVYFIPLWLLHWQKRLRAIDMQREVDQIHTLIAILSQFERMSVEHVLEWMERSATIFKAPLQTCLLHYDSGAANSLEQLKEDVVFVPFVRIVERLQLAVEKISLQFAFDDLEMEREYYKEKREQHYEKVIEQKSSWGKLIGFAPMYALVFMYLVLPLLYLSSIQMSHYVKILQN